MKKTVLVILDGFGLGEHSLKSNAIYTAKTPFFDKVLSKVPYASLLASEEAVGIAKHQFGNSEIGHMTLGAGRVIDGISQYVSRLIDNNKFKEYLLDQPWFLEVIKNKDKIFHLCGMYSSGGVHSHKKHFDAIIEILQDFDVKIALHLFSDGRDTSKFVFYEDIKELIKKLKPTTKIVSVAGRYYGMDRDQRWERTNLSFKEMVEPHKSDIDVLSYIKSQYDENIDDEFIKPMSFTDEYLINKDDTLCFLNFRADRMRQIFHKFKKTEIYDLQHCEFEDLKVISLCEYPNTNADHLIFSQIMIEDTLGTVLNNHQIKQLRIAETEKYAHVTFFFDGGKEVTHPNQQHVLIPSAKVATYDLKPEMSAEQITDKIIEMVNDFEVCIVNYANADMVGHTGNFNATVKAIEVLDKELEKLYNTIVLEHGGNLLITADHGNADCMLKDDTIVKTHTLAPVPFIVLSDDYEISIKDGSLQDVAPTILYMLGLEQPTSMTGRNLAIEK